MGKIGPDRCLRGGPGIHPIVALTIGGAVWFIQSIREGNQQNKRTEDQGDFFDGRGEIAKPVRIDPIGIFPNRVGQRGQGKGKIGVDIGKIGRIQGANRQTTDQETQSGGKGIPPAGTRHDHRQGPSHHEQGNRYDHHVGVQVTI